jgi:catechol 2,3-dioxygenase-like lactoylglutathione lyase family enzyme
MVQAIGLDHIVLAVADVERSVAWYHDHLGLEVLRLDEWRDGKVLFPSVRLDGTTIIDVFKGERSGVNVDHFAVVVEDDVDALAGSDEFEVVGGPADLFGARGTGRGIYVKDPDGNTVELRSYPAATA